MGVKIMKFRKIMLVTLLLLAVLTIGAASAAEVADGTGNETVIESPADYVIGTSEGNDDLSVNPKDFNVTFLADEVDIKDENVLEFENTATYEKLDRQNYNDFVSQLKEMNENK